MTPFDWFLTYAFGFILCWLLSLTIDKRVDGKTALTIAFVFWNVLCFAGFMAYETFKFLQGM